MHPIDLPGIPEICMKLKSKLTYCWLCVLNPKATANWKIVRWPNVKSERSRLELTISAYLVDTHATSEQDRKEPPQAALCTWQHTFPPRLWEARGVSGLGLPGCPKVHKQVTVIDSWHPHEFLMLCHRVAVWGRKRLQIRELSLGKKKYIYLSDRH